MGVPDETGQRGVTLSPTQSPFFDFLSPSATIPREPVVPREQPGRGFVGLRLDRGLAAEKRIHSPCGGE